MLVPFSTIDALLKRTDAITAEMAQTLDPARTVALAKELSSLEERAAMAREVLKIDQEIEELKQMLGDAALDAELVEIARSDLQQLEELRPEKHRMLALALLPRDEADQRSAILEVRAGTGGDEAAIFAGDLFRMYSRYAATRGWKVEVLSESEADMGGYREIIAEVTGAGVYGALKYESGVHRVQRVPDTETQGRIHTSAATVAVLPEAAEVDFDIQESDLRVDVYRASGAGGQHVNKTESAVRITHIPTGVVVAVQDDRSQHRNRAKALSLLRAKLYDDHRRTLEAQRSADRKSQVGSGDRSERIRTYNFPQGRLTDHRINLTLYSLDKIIAGESLGDVLLALIRADEEQRLAQGF